MKHTISVFASVSATASSYDEILQQSEDNRKKAFQQMFDAGYTKDNIPTGCIQYKIHLNPSASYKYPLSACIARAKEEFGGILLQVSSDYQSDDEAIQECVQKIISMMDRYFPESTTVSKVIKTKQDIDKEINILEEKFDKITNEIDQKQIDRDKLIDANRSTNNIDRVIDNMEQKQGDFQTKIEQLQKDRKKAKSAVTASSREFFVQIEPSQAENVSSIVKKEVTTDFDTDITDVDGDTIVFTNVENLIKTLDLLSVYDIKIVSSSH